MRLMLVMGLASCALSSCGMIVGTPSGVREMSRWHNGLVVTGKAKPNELDEYHKTERYTEGQKTLRITFGGQGGRTE